MSIYFLNSFSLFFSLFIFCYLFKILKMVVFIVIMKVIEKFIKIFNFLLNIFFTTRKKYLKEKHRTTKEKLARAKTWARKHESNLGTVKGFHIPIAIPQTEQAKFFQKKREEDEQRVRDEEILKKEKKNQKYKHFYTKKPVFEISKTGFSTF